MKAIIVSCLFFAAAFALPSRPQLRPKILTRDDNNNVLIIGGSDAVPNSRPFQVSLQLQVSGGYAHFCGGSIIAPNKVVTAAHCLDTGFDIRSLRVVAGDHNLYANEGTEQPAAWASYVWHPKWDYNTLDFDYGVITLATNLTFNEYVQPIPLANWYDIPFGDCSASGWGYISPGGAVPSILQQINLPYVPRGRCQKAYDPIRWEITDQMICAGGDFGRSVCSGDSGGPLTCKGLNGEYLAGIASYVMPECGENNYPDGFANVGLPSEREWLLSN